MSSQELRRNFLNYFKKNGHSVIPSSSVVPHDDPTLLFTNAGMNQFKDIFLGKSVRDYKRATTAQKCIRVGGKHNDLDNVGHTSRHLTFFEMLGNFSFGDYFKKEAIQYAWEVSTEVFKFSPNDIWVTIFETDDEAFELWKKWVKEDRIVRFGEKDNFWAMGDTGPCGPCSELYFDRGSKYGAAPTPREDASGERYLEFWNLVFMQYNRDLTGKLTPLPKQSIDTGAGIERVASLKLNVDTVFGTDILRDLIAQVEQVSGKQYAENPAFHVIADHIRSLSFAISDGAQPSNVERGYVLRKLIRRAVRYGRGLGMQEPFLAKILPRLTDLMGEDYPELVASQHRIAEILTLEEESFIRTLKRGGNILNTVIDQALKSPLKQINGEEAFKLKDTYGFPLEEILLIAKDTRLEVNLEAYELLEEQAKEKSRSASSTHVQQAEESLFKDYIEKHGMCGFTGYDETETKGTIMAIVSKDRFVDTLLEGEEGMVILSETPFYAEKGGQIGDIGILKHHKAEFIVTATHSPYPNVIVHIGKLNKGVLITGEPVVATIDIERRRRIANNHTATHLLHLALQVILGPHIRQAGSLVETNRLRFDFNHHKPLSPQEITLIENFVNDKIRENNSVKTYELSYEDAQKRSDIKQFFGDKYGAKVRVVESGDSKELCGGTHVDFSGRIGLFRIIKESSIAAGVRRIEAVTGKEAEAFMHNSEAFGLKAADMLKTSLTQLPEKVNALIEENKSLGIELKILRKNALKTLAEDLAQKITPINGIPFLASIAAIDAEELPLLADELINKTRSLLLILAIKQTERCQLLIRVTPDLVQKGISAVAIIKEIAPLAGGNGGGKTDSAQAGGKNPLGIEHAFAKAQTLLQTL
jgi:alanyl-tRNA synthetase